MTESLEDFLQRISGQWRGTEKMVVDPSNGTEMTTEATLTNTICLGGMGFVSDYVQTHDGKETIRCQTTYRFESNDGVTALWLPSSGSFQHFEGTLKDGLIEVFRTDENGMNQTLKTDYSEKDAFTTRTTMSPPSGPEMTVFEGVYKRQVIS